MSANKRKCIRCLAKEAAANLEAKGIEYTEEQLRLLIREEAGVL